MIKKHAKRDDDTDEFEEDWTIVEDDEEMHPDVYPLEAQMAAVMAMNQAGTDRSNTGAGTLALGSMVLKGASTSRRISESACRGS